MSYAMAVAQPQQMRPSSPQVIQTAGDGDCMFATICLGLGPESAYNVASLRQAVVDYQLAHRDRFEGFNLGDFDAHMEAMRRPQGAWGGHPELVVASELVERELIVWRQQRA